MNAYLKTAWAVAGAVAAAGAYWKYQQDWSPEARERIVSLAKREAMMDRVRSELKDPASAQFKLYSQGDDYLCGEVNAKNSYGGYTGYRWFTVKHGKVDLDPDAYDRAVGRAYYCK